MPTRMVNSGDNSFPMPPGPPLPPPPPPAGAPYGYFPPSARPPRVRPKSVRNAVRLIWLSIALSTVAMAYILTRADELAQDMAVDAGIDAASSGTDEILTIVYVSLLAAFLVMTAVVAVFAIFIAKGAEWARIIYTVLTALGTLWALAGIVFDFELNFELLFGLISTAIAVASVALLFTRESNRYFGGQ